MNKDSQTKDELTGVQRTPLHASHQESGGKLMPFAGFEMPIQYSLCILKEHLHTRAAAGLFDVSHVGQAELRGDGAAALIENWCLGGYLWPRAPSHALYSTHE